MPLVTNLISSAIITAYVSTGNPCASGHKPHSHYTIAAPRSIPLGSHVVIDGNIYTVEDRTAKHFNGRFDIFMDSKQAALNFGKQQHTVTVIIYEHTKIN